MWVIPDGRWSDHAGQKNPTSNIGLGPDFVANIVNLLGRTSSQGACTGSMPNWSNTVLLVVWDDWGGWYDHVKPFSVTGYIGGNGNGQQYVYGLSRATACCFNLREASLHLEHQSRLRQHFKTHRAGVHTQFSGRHLHDLPVRRRVRGRNRDGRPLGLLADQHPAV